MIREMGVPPWQVGRLISMRKFFWRSKTTAEPVFHAKHTFLHHFQNIWKQKKNRKNFEKFHFHRGTPTNFGFPHWNLSQDFPKLKIKIFEIWNRFSPDSGPTLFNVILNADFGFNTRLTVDWKKMRFQQKSEQSNKQTRRDFFFQIAPRKKTIFPKLAQT